ncbi:MAG: FkbM family methyltransferase, partial [Flavobacteriales bacterium]|nr:FkbM family methyltransferase [Flavobacteriales bacterium]
MRKTINYIKQRIEQTQKIAQLNVAETGVDKDGDAFIRLVDGPVFYGERAYPKDKKYYYTLPVSVRRRIPFEAMRVAIDIVTRFFEGGLMYGGPFKNDQYQPDSGDIAVEMGAFRGYFILRLCQWVGEKGKVVAIEPMPENVRILKKNIKANSIKNCTVIEKGVWHKADAMVFNKKEKDNQSSSLVISDHGSEKYSVPVDSLDKIFDEAGLQYCDFMVIQLNGVEIDALNGMTKIRPKNMAIAARYDKPGQNAIEAIGSWMKKCGYKHNVVKKRFIYATLNS